MFRKLASNNRNCSYFYILLEYSVPEVKVLLKNVLHLWHMKH